MMKITRDQLRKLIRESLYGYDPGLITESFGGVSKNRLLVGDYEIDAEIVEDQASRSLGLMYRHHMPENAGMLFSFPADGHHSFWMRNTNIPLSIAFIDSAGEIVQINELHPHDEVSVRPVKPCRYALETNQGWFDKRGIGKGTRVTKAD